MKKLLLVDDDLTVGAIIKQGMEDLDIEVTTVEDSISAIKLLSNSTVQYDLMLLDINLEVLNGVQRTGFDVLDESKSHIPFVILTSSTEKNIVNKAAKHSVLGFIIKPILITHLKPQIIIALNQAELSQKMITAFEHNSTIDIVVGLFMEKLKITRQQAENTIRSHCRAQRIKMALFAKNTLEEYEKNGGKLATDFLVS